MKVVTVTCSMCQDSQEVEGYNRQQAMRAARDMGWTGRPLSGLYLCPGCSIRMEAAEDDMEECLDG